MRIDIEPSVSVDRCFREFYTFATGRSIPDDRPIQIIDFNISITQSLVNRLAIVGLSAITYHARRGSLKAGQYLTDRALGSCERPFNERVMEMTEEQAKMELLNEFTSAGLSPTLSAQLMDRLLTNSEV